VVFEVTGEQDSCPDLVIRAVAKSRIIAYANFALLREMAQCAGAKVRGNELCYLLFAKLADVVEAVPGRTRSCLCV
jgi:hypothetical protein